MDFQNAPPAANYGSNRMADWEAIAAELREHPGEWALIVTAKTRALAGQASINIRIGRYVAFRPEGSFDAVSRGLDVWASYKSGE